MGRGGLTRWTDDLMKITGMGASTVPNYVVTFGGGGRGRISANIIMMIFLKQFNL